MSKARKAERNAKLTASQIEKKTKPQISDEQEQQDLKEQESKLQSCERELDSMIEEKEFYVNSIISSNRYTDERGKYVALQNPKVKSKIASFDSNLKNLSKSLAIRRSMVYDMRLSANTKIARKSLPHSSIMWIMICNRWKSNAKGSIFPRLQPKLMDIVSWYVDCYSFRLVEVFDDSHLTSDPETRKMIAKRDVRVDDFIDELYLLELINKNK